MVTLIITPQEEKVSCSKETFAERIDARVSGSVIMVNSVVQFRSHANADN